MSFTVRKDRASYPPQRIAFDNFEADLRSGELRKAGYRIRLQAQPFQVLALLLVNAGEVVARDEICRELWPGDTFVDFEHGLAAAVNKVREALGDSADTPRYIETLPKRGYRFIGKILPQPPVVMSSPDAEHGEGPKLETMPVQVAGSAHATKGTATEAGVVEGRAGWNWRAVTAVAVIAIAAVTAAAFVWTSRKPAAVMTTEQLPMVVPFTSLPGLETMASFSPDGSRIAFAWDNNTENETGTPKYDLYVKAIGSETLLKLTHHPSDVLSSTWSPDGTQIAFHRSAPGDNAIYVVPALGGPERKLIDTNSPWDITAPLSWSPDGKTIGYASVLPGTTSIRGYLLNIETLESREVRGDPTCRHSGTPNFSPSGKQLVMVCAHNLDDLELTLMNADGTSPRALTKMRDFIGGLAWTPNDASIITDTWKGGREEIDEVRLSDGVRRRIPGLSGGWATLSKDGTTLAFTEFDTRMGLWRKDLQHPNAPLQAVAASTQMQNEPRYSPDGKHIAFDSARSGEWSVWMADPDGSNPIQLSQGGAAGYPTWSPDSQKIVFQMGQSDGHVGLYVIGIGEEVAHRLKVNVDEATAPVWSHDGKWIYFRGYRNKSRQIYRSPAGGGDVSLVLDMMDLTDEEVESPDGKTLYFMNDDGTMFTATTGGTNVEAAQVPGLPRLAPNSPWTLLADGIYFVPADKSRSLWFYDFATKKTREVFHIAKNFSEGMSLSPDGRYLLYSQVDQNNSDIMLARNFR
jgi:Tol biopolymer transport system component/DNA-binding winged helix-turn-helix (wHTH) protein